MKYLIAIVVGIFLATTVSAVYVVHEKGEWSDWWETSRYTRVRRIYDHENKLVCWMADSYSNGVGISCVPSLELEHPMTK